MSLITVDPQRCTRDGICSAECPLGLIQPDAEGLPQAVPGAEAFCAACGHCVAYCPHGALSLTGSHPLAPDDCRPVRRDIQPGPEALTALFETRRSVRSFKDKPVERAVIDGLLDVVRYAPSGLNHQPVHWLVSGSAQSTRQLAGLIKDWLQQNNVFPGLVAAWDQGKDMILRGAPHVIVAHADAGVGSSQMDCVIAGTWLELLIHTHGLGACWAGMLIMAASAGHAPLLDALNIPDGHKVFAALMLGHPRYRIARIPARLPARVRWI